MLVVSANDKYVVLGLHMLKVHMLTQAMGQVGEEAAKDD